MFTRLTSRICVRAVADGKNAVIQGSAARGIHHSA